MEEQKRLLCQKYVRLVFESFLNNTGYEVEEERIKLHDEICEIFKVERGTIAPITSNMDAWLKVPASLKKITSQFVVEKGTLLQSILDSDDVQKGSWDTLYDATKAKKSAWWNLD